MKDRRGWVGDTPPSLPVPPEVPMLSSLGDGWAMSASGLVPNVDMVDVEEMLLEPTVVEDRD